MDTQDCVFDEQGKCACVCVRFLCYRSKQWWKTQETKHVYHHQYEGDMLQCFRISESKLCHGYTHMENQKSRKKMKERVCSCACVWQNFMPLPLSIIFHNVDMYAPSLWAIHTTEYTCIVERIRVETELRKSEITHRSFRISIYKQPEVCV